MLTGVNDRATLSGDTMSTRRITRDVCRRRQRKMRGRGEL